MPPPDGSPVGDDLDQILIDAWGQKPEQSAEEPVVLQGTGTPEDPYRGPVGRGTVARTLVNVTVPKPSSQQEGPGDNTVSVPVLVPNPKEPTKAEIVKDVAKQAIAGPLQLAQQLTSGHPFTPVPEVNQMMPATTGAGAVTRFVTEQMAGLIGGAKLFQTANILQGTGNAVLRAGVLGSAVNGSLFDASTQRLSNIVSEHSALLKPISDILAAEEDDSQVTAYAKEAIENMMTAGAAEGLVGLVKAVKTANALRAAGKVEAAEKAVAEALAKSEAQKAATSANAAKAYDPAAKLEPKALDNLITNVKADIDNAVEPTGKPPLKALNLDRMDGPIDAKTWIDNTAKEIEAKGGTILTEVQTHKMVEAEAKLFGETAADHWEAVAGDIKTTEQLGARMVARRGWMQRLAKNVSDERTKINNGVGDPARYEAAIQELGQYIVANKKISKGVARAQGAGRIRTVADLTPQEQAALAAAGGDVEKVFKILKPKGIGRRIFDAYTSGWINAILGGLRTQEANIISNTGMALLQPIEIGLGEAVSGSLPRAGTHLLAGQVRHLTDSIRLAKLSWDMEGNILEGSSKVLESDTKALSFKGLGITANNGLAQVTDSLLTAARTPTRFLSSTDELYKQVAFRSYLSTELMQEGIKRGLKGADLNKFIDDMFELGFDDSGRAVSKQNHDFLFELAKKYDEQTAEMLGNMGSDALAYAQRGTLTLPLRPKTGGAVLSQALNNPVGKLINPFVRTPVNAFRQFGQRLPLGLNLLYKEMQEEWKAGGLRRKAVYGKLVTGNAMWAGATYLAGNGLITGSGPRNPEARKELMATGWRPRSVRINGAWQSYDGLAPFSMFLGVSADFAETAHFLKDEDYEEYALAMSVAMFRNATNQPYVKGLSDFLDMALNPVEADQNGVVSGLSARVGSFLRQRAASHIPAIFQESAALVGQGDDHFREVNDLGDALRSKIPFFSEGMQPERDRLGRPVWNDRRASPAGVLRLTNRTPDAVNPVDAELARIGGSIGKAPKIINNGQVNLTEFTNKKGQTAYNRLLELRSEPKNGRNLEERLAEELKKDSYAKASIPKKQDKLSEIFGDYQHHSLKKLVKSNEFPGLKEAIEAAEQKAKLLKKAPDTAFKKPQEPLNQLLQFTNPQ